MGGFCWQMAEKFKQARITEDNKRSEDCFTIKTSRERLFVELDLIIRFENWFLKLLKKTFEQWVKIWIRILNYS